MMMTITRVNELPDILDDPVNTNDYSTLFNQNTEKPTQSVVEVNHPQQAPLHG